LAEQIDRLMPASAVAALATAVIVPHGSLAQAGQVTGTTLARVMVPRRCIIIGPSHVERWMPAGLMTSGSYRTPLGDVPVDTETAERLWALCPFLQVDAWNQRGEHAIEVVLPFLQRRAREGLQIVPVMLSASEPEQVTILAAALAQVVRRVGEPVLLIASAEFSRFRPASVVRAQDERLAACLQGLHGGEFLHLVEEAGIAMCGQAAVASVIEAARALGARRCIQAAYATSAQAGGDPESSTGFAGFIVSEG
jgi:AmmeMemoRadiSam system protein B